MLTHDVINQMKEFVSNNDDIEGLAILGSHAREDAGPKADLDLVLFAPKTMPEKILSEATDILLPMNEFVIKPDTKKWILFLGAEFLRVDLSAIQEISEIKVLYQGSLIDNPNKAVLIDKKGLLINTFREWKDEAIKEKTNLFSLVSVEVEKFLDAFETASRYANQSDVFRFYFNYNLAFTRYARLVQLERGNYSFLYTPRRFLEDMSTDRQRSTERLASTLKLSEIPPKMEHMAAEFLLAYGHLYLKYPELSRSPREIFAFIRSILTRDMVWNLRDIAWVAPDILQKGILYRSSTLSRFESRKEYDLLIKQLGIERIIDLRLEHEICRYPYTEYTYEFLDVQHLGMNTKLVAPFVFGPLTNSLHADLLNNADVIRDFFAFLAQRIPTLVHCHSGKDRTGVLIALAELVAGVPEELVKKDFLATGMNLKEKDADNLFGRIEELGGVHNILQEIGVPKEHIMAVKQWLCNGC
jgi:hypothetical protein